MNVVDELHVLNKIDSLWKRIYYEWVQIHCFLNAFGE